MEMQTEEVEARGVATLELETRHEVALVVDAFSARAKTLEDLAKKNQGEGYTDFASRLVTDAVILKQRVAPRIAAQRVLPLPTVEDLQRHVASLLSPAIARRFSGMVPIDSKDQRDKDLLDAIQFRKEELIRELSEAITRFVIATAQSGYDHGYQVRTRTNEAIALDALEVLRGVWS